MLLLKFMLLITGCAMVAVAAALVIRDLKQKNTPNWAFSSRIAMFAAPLLLLGLSISMVGSGEIGLRVSQFGGVRADTLYPGVYWTWPLIERIERFETRDRVYQTSNKKSGEKDKDGLRVNSKEGLNAGLGVALRYRVDPSKLAYVYSSLPGDIEEDLIAPLVASQFREIAPNYPVKELFAGKREELRAVAAGLIAKKLSADGIVVKEVLLRDVILPAEYAKGLESLLLKEQESERLTVALDAKQKEVKVEALEADSRKNSTVKEAEAQAQAKVLDSHAEQERLKLLAEAEEFKVRKLAGANAEKLRMEADVLKNNPMVIQKIIAERLSDKVQIIMAPSDGKYFFASDVLRGGMMGSPALMTPPQP